MRDFKSLLVQNPGWPLIVTPDAVITRAEMLRYTDNYAKAMYADGVREGETVIVVAPGLIQQFKALLACVYIGATPIFARFEAPEMPGVRVYSIADFYRWDSEDHVGVVPAPTTDFVVFFKSTSGTTGKPKTFAITRSWLDARIDDDIKTYGFGPGDGHLFTRSNGDLAHPITTMDHFMTAVACSVAYMVPPRDVSVTDFIALVKRLTSLAPSGKIVLQNMWGDKTGEWPSAFLRDFAAKTDDLQGVRLLTFSPNISVEVYDVLRSKTSAEICNHWACTETSKRMLTTSADPEEKRRATFGRLGEDFRVIDGELFIRKEHIAPLATTGSHGKVELDGFVGTGDMVTEDADGYVSFVGRKLST